MNPTFENRLVDALQPVRFHALAMALYQLFETGLFDHLAGDRGQTVEEMAEELKMDPWRLQTFLHYLRNEGYVGIDADGGVRLGAAAQALEPYRPWYTMMVGGYTPTWMGMGAALAAGSPPAPRDLRQVGVGSCGISHHDAIPLTRRLMSLAPTPCTRLLDLGCGNGLYLVEFCLALPDIERAWGIEPSAASCADAQRLIARHGLQDRVAIINGVAASALEIDPSLAPNFAVIGFVLHEILGQEGREGVIRFLQGLVGRFPQLNLIVIEVDGRLHDTRSMSDALGQAYYNPYSTLHPFTLQRLESPVFWERLFSDAGLDMLARLTTDPEVDSTGLELGYLLRKAA
jgi:2-ketoarginine methyltransferase